MGTPGLAGVTWLVVPGGVGPQAWAETLTEAPLGWTLVLELWAALTSEPGVEPVVMVPPEPRLL